MSARTDRARRAGDQAERAGLHRSQHPPVRKEMTLRLEEELYERLREVAYKLRLSKQQLMTDALEAYLLHH
jgi:hypothetical protein